MRKANGATPPSMDVLSKLITRLFDIQPMHVCTGGEKRVLFKNLGPRTTNICDTVNIPSVCKIQSLEPNLTFKCPMPVLIDNIQQYCLVTFEKNDFTIELNKVKLSSDFPIPIVQSNVEGIIHLVSNIRLCWGVPRDNEYFPKSFCEEKMSTTYDNSYKVVMRSKFCKQIVDWLATRNTACTSCHELHHARKRREKKRKLEVNSEAENKENNIPVLRQSQRETQGK